MRNYAFLGLPNRPGLPLVSLAIFLALLLVAGGASRADVTGQVVVRAGAWCAIVAMMLFGPRPSWRDASPVQWFLVATAVLILLHLVPLPPALWQALPGHRPLMEADALAGQGQLWRPLSIVPSATWNALWSLAVPAAVMMLWTGMQEEERACLPGLLTIVIALSALAGLMQLSGSGFDNPFINETAWDVRGTLANRNHFAVLLALGCLIVPVWGLADRRRRGWREAAVVGLLLIFVLLILATGSRAGLLVGLIALAFLPLLAGRWFRHAPRWLLPAAIAALVVVVVVALVAGRAMSVDRAFAIDPAQDMRTRSFSSVMSMIASYLPFGSGIGAFEPAFRMIEPFAMLKPTFFNHAHNDFLELALTAGLPGLLLLFVAVVWLIAAAVRVWRASPSSRTVVRARLGSAMLLVVLVASLFDYPARSPLMMAILMLAALWLGSGQRATRTVGLPDAGLHL